MSYRLSLLDKSPVLADEPASSALQRTLQLAQQAERWGYTVSGWPNITIPRSWRVRRRRC